MKLFQSIITAFIVIIFSVGCQKNENAKPPAPVSDDEPANLMNPYDSFGYWHNVILDSIEQQRKVGGCADFTGSCNYIRKFYRMKNWSELAESHFNEISQQVVNAASDMDGFIDGLQWSDSVKTRVKELTKILMDQGTDSCTYPCLKNKVKAFEEEVLLSSLSDFEKEVILKATSVARYSGYRWIQQPELKQKYDYNELLRQFQSTGLAANVKVAEVQRSSLLGRIGKWIAVTMIDISSAIGDLSVASGSEASDFMRELMK